MGFLTDKIRGLVLGERKSYEQWAGSSIRMYDTTVSSAIDPASLRAMAYAVGHVDRCANKISSVASQHQPRLFRRGKASGLSGKPVSKSVMALLRGHTETRVGVKAMSMVQADDAIEIEEGDAVDFIRNPCPLYSGAMWRYLNTYHMQICGDWWAHAAEGPEGGVGIYPMLPQFVSLRLSPEGHIARVLYARDGSRKGGVGQEFDPEECLSWRFRPSRTSLYRGEGWLVGCIQEAALLQTALLAQSKSWENMQRPDYSVKIPETANKDQIKDVRDELLARHGGPTRVMRPIVLRGGDVTPLSWSPKDQMFDSQIERMQDAIRQAAGIPEPLFNMTDTTFANADTSVIIFARDTIQPLLNTVAEQDSEQLLPLMGLSPEDYFIAYTDVVPVSREEKTKIASALFQTGAGIVNEIRGQLGFEPVDNEWGNTPPAPQMYRMPVTAPNESRDSFGLSPVEGGDTLGRSGPMPGAQPPAAPAPDANAKPEEKPKPEDAAKSVRKSMALPFSGYGQACGCVKKSPPNPLTENGIQRFADQLELWYNRTARTFTANPDGTVNMGEAAAQLARMLENPLEGISDRAIQNVTRQFPDRAENLKPEAMRQFVDTYRVQLANGISDRLSDDLTAAIQGSINSGGGLTETLAAVREKLPEEAGWRALRIANTETATMEGEASVFGWEQVGITKKEWMLAAGGCPICEAFVAQYASGPVAIGHIYAPAGTSITGTDGTTYTTYRDVKSAPLHPNCRCIDLPVLGGNDND